LAGLNRGPGDRGQGVVPRRHKNEIDGRMLEDSLPFIRGLRTEFGREGTGAIERLVGADRDAPRERRRAFAPDQAATDNAGLPICLARFPATRLPLASGAAIAPLSEIPPCARRLAGCSS